MRNLGMENWLLSDEESFYRWIQPVRDGWGAVVCAGTSFVVKRKALDQIGGFVEQAISEDFVSNEGLPFMGYMEGDLFGVKARIFRISFSGELAYEVNVESDNGNYMWEKIIEVGQEFKIQPYGTEAL